VDLLLQPAAFSRDISFRTWKSFRETRAVENGVYFLGVNYAGDNFGDTTIVPPWVDEHYEPQSLGTEDGYLVAKLTRAALQEARESMPFYRALCSEFADTV